MEDLGEHAGRAGDVRVRDDGHFPLIVLHQLDDVQKVKIGDGNGENRPVRHFFDLQCGTAPRQDGVKILAFILPGDLAALFQGADFHRQINVIPFVGFADQGAFERLIGSDGQDPGFMMHRHFLRMFHIRT